MSKTVSPGYTDTPIVDVSSLTFPRGLVNFAQDWRVKSVTPGKEVILTNITSPPDQPEKLRIAYNEVANIYNGSDASPTINTPSTSGVQILVQLTEVQSVTDSADAGYRVDLPISAHLVIKAPKSAQVTASTIETVIGRLISGLFDTGLTTSSRLEGLMRGALVPSEV